MQILLLEDYPEIKIDYLEYVNVKHNRIFTLNDHFKPERIEVLMVRSNKIVGRKLLDEFPKTKYVCRVGVGLEKIDVEECANRGIEVINTPGANADSVADLVLAGVLQLSRKTHIEFEGIENRFDYKGFEINSKTVGIIGFGNIGKKVYERFKGFGVKDFYIYDPFISEDSIENYDRCHYVKNKNDIFKKCDLISFHIPLLDSTRNFLGKKEFKLLDPETIIVNTSRGGIINENKLIEFLSENKYSGAVLDVWEEEPSDPKMDFLELENCIITPHIGAMTWEAEEKMHYFPEIDPKNR